MLSEIDFADDPSFHWPRDGISLWTDELRSRIALMSVSEIFMRQTNRYKRTLTLTHTHVHVTHVRDERSEGGRA